VIYVGLRGTQIVGAKSPGQLNFVQWHLIFVDLWYGTCFMLTLLVPRNFEVAATPLEKFVHRWFSLIFTDSRRNPQLWHAP
jgi:hypothetical protein